MTTDYPRRDDLDGTLSSSLTLDELRKYFHLPIIEVARQLGTCTTALKKVCRRYKIQKWPHRQIRSLTKSIQSLEMAMMNDSITEDIKQQYREQILTLQKAIDDIVFDPNTNISDLAKKLENEWGNSPNDDKWAMGAEPSENAKQLIQAAALVSESSSSKPSTKRKYSHIEDKSGSGDASVSSEVSTSHRPQPPQPPPPIPLPPPKPPVEMVNIGLTQVSHVTLTGSDSKSGTIHFVGPVVLAPLERRRISKQASKKLVPLIEPDICNHFKMEFLPQGSIFEIKYFRDFASNQPGNIDYGHQQIAYDPATQSYPNQHE